VVAEMAEPANPDWADASFGARLTASSVAVAELVAVGERLEDVADDDLPAVMRDLTTLVGQLDGLRVAVTRQVRDRGVFRRQGATSVVGWLRSDVRTADVAWSLAQLAAKAEDLPRISGLLEKGAVSLAQAGTACWQINRLPTVPQEPRPADDQDPQPDADQNAQPDAELDPQPDDELWAGLWRNGDVHAAADELFGRFLPRLDSDRLRALGAHLREAADRQERAGEDYDTYARRCLRLSRGFDGIGELSGRLHPEAAEQVLAAFDELGAKAGPDDTRTKAQRWADALVYLTGLAGLSIPGDRTPGRPEPGHPDPGHPEPGHPDPGHPEPGHPEPGRPESAGPAEGGTGGAGDDDQPCPDGGHGHDGPGGTVAQAGAGQIVPMGLRRPRVIVTVPLSSLLGQPFGPGAVLGTGTPITAEAARRLSCDAEIVRLITSTPPGPSSSWVTPEGRDATGQLTELLARAVAELPRPLGSPSAALDIGRKSQSWTPRQRDALHALYGGRCSAPGCTSAISVIHHIVHWVHGGLTKISNGAPFCLYHHWLVHEGGWRVVKEPDGTLILIAPPPGWRPGMIYRRGKPLPETATGASADAT
jgi:hypothetical protein